MSDAIFAKKNLNRDHLTLNIFSFLHVLFLRKVCSNACFGDMLFLTKALETCFANISSTLVLRKKNQLGKEKTTFNKLKRKKVNTVSKSVI